MTLDRRPPEEAVKWLVYATEDLAVARLLLAHGDAFIRQAMHQAQQCAEKALKGFLIAKDQPFPLTHSIETLRRLCCALDPTLDESARPCVDLSPFAGLTRYPGWEDPDHKTAQAFFSVAEALLAAVLDRLRVS